jgi:hypothetical protein
MSFRFTPLSDAELNELQNKDLLPDGNYAFIVKEAATQTSSKGNPMLKVILEVLASPQDKHLVTDFLTVSEKMIFKLKHFCETLGLDQQYSEGNLRPEDCIGKMGKCKIGRQKGEQKRDLSGYFPDRNCVKDYIKSVDQGSSAKVDSNFNDDITF